MASKFPRKKIPNAAGKSFTKGKIWRALDVYGTTQKKALRKT